MPRVPTDAPIAARVRGMSEGDRMTATALPPREIDFNLPPAIDIASFRRVTAGLTRCALEAAAPRPDDLAGRTECRGRLIRAVHANMELWAVVLHEVLD